MQVELHAGRQLGDTFWHLWDSDPKYYIPPPAVPPGDVLIQQLVSEKSAGGAFSDVIECACGRRWRAILDPPKVVEDGLEVEGGSSVPEPSEDW